MSLHANDVDRAWGKLNMVIKDKNDRRALFYYDGKLILNTKRSMGRGTIDGQVRHFIRQQMKLSSTEFDELIACPLDLPKYVRILKNKGII